MLCKTTCMHAYTIVSWKSAYGWSTLQFFQRGGGCSFECFCIQSTPTGSSVALEVWCSTSSHLFLLVHIGSIFQKLGNNLLMTFPTGEEQSTPASLWIQGMQNELLVILTALQTLTLSALPHSQACLYLQFWLIKMIENRDWKRPENVAVVSSDISVFNAHNNIQSGLCTSCKLMTFLTTYCNK